MNSYKQAGNIKAALFVFGIILISGIFMYTNYLINELRKDNSGVVKLYSEIIAEAIKDKNDTNLNFIFENIIQKIKFPIIQSNTKKVPQLWQNMPENNNSLEDASKMLILMDKLNKPIELFYESENSTIRFGYLHYGDSVIIQKLQFWRYIVIFGMLCFIFIGFAGFTFIRNTEKKHIWVGLSRETAHQLGTPLSGLIGWIDRIKSNPEELDDIVLEMETDLERLLQISRRFSKMGSKIHLENINLTDRLENISVYLEKRIPSLQNTININNHLEKNIIINGNGPLLSWAIENIIKNGIDSIKRSNGQINIFLKVSNKNAVINIEDNGSGIPKKDWKNIFRPGFSTKNAGWGLGLSLAQRIVTEIHKGKLFILKSDIKNGTNFQIDLPL